MQVQYFHLTLKIKGREEKEEAERVKALSLYVKVRHVAFAFALYYVIGVRRRVLSVKSHCPCPDGAVSDKFREKHAQNNQ